DEPGRKTTKALGTALEPLDVIEKHGADAMRYPLSTGRAPGQDLRLSTEKVDRTWTLINKLWHPSRIVLMNMDHMK
ncbi:class I tRNA ligase family protein, partial [Bacillus cereus]|nr:class I tRNA ligase family protein [Bacillus cereus]